MTASDRNALLKRVFHFNNNDITHNRAGDLSKRQKWRLLVKMLFSIEIILMLIVGIPGLIFLLIQVVFPDGYSVTVLDTAYQVVEPGRNLFSLLNIIVLIGSLIFIFEGIITARATLRDLLGGEVEYWYDNFTPRKRVGRKSGFGMVNVYELLIDGSPTTNHAGLSLTKKQFKNIPGHATYEVFVAKYTRTIVAMLYAQKPIQNVPEHLPGKPTMQPSESVPPMADNPFAEIFQFTQADLDKNRQGILTSNQADRIRQTRGFGGIGDRTVVAYRGNIEKWDDVGMKGNKKYYLKFEAEHGGITIDFRLLEGQYTQLKRAYRDVILYATQPTKVVVAIEQVRK